MREVLTFLVSYALIPSVLFCWVAYEWYTLKRERERDADQARDEAEHPES
ncbi:MAG: hypothetical protein HKO62_07795 [Gammaproteobacteria bacterium]|nr:hypothetical protein [Gammaproteobacteria bacterium]